MTERIALLHWGDVLEDYLDSVGLSLQTFRDEVTGGWTFGYVEALRRVGIETLLVCISRGVERRVRWRHGPTGTPMFVLPASPLYRLLRRPLRRDPYAWSVREAVGGGGPLRLAAGAFAWQIAPYCATPLRALAQELKREKCSAILCQEYEYQRFDVSVLLGRLLRLPVFATFQAGDAHRTALEGWLRPLALRACNGVVIGASSEAERVRRVYGVPAEKIAQVFNPVDLSFWRPADRGAARAALALPADRNIVVWHGRVEIHNKGLDVLLDAWQQLSEANALLVLVGTGSQAEELRARLADPGFASVRWVDDYVLDRERIRLFLSAADVYAFPSRHEGFAVAPLEAIACGLPVVAADAAGVVEVFPEGERSGGVIVRRGDAAAFAAGLRGLLENPSRRDELGRRARERAEAAFSFEAVGAGLRDFFVRRGLRQPRRPPR